MGRYRNGGIFHERQHKPYLCLFIKMSLEKTHEISDKPLVIALREGDQEAFEKIYRKYSEKVYYFAIRYQNSPEDAENVVQDVFIKIWNERKSLKEDLSFNSYIFTITKNHLFNKKRKSLNENAYREYLIHHLTSTENKLERQIIYSDLKELLDAEIERLPKQRRKVFELSVFQGLSNKEIAEEMDLSVRTVEVHKSLALKTLRKINKL